MLSLPTNGHFFAVAICVATNFRTASAGLASDVRDDEDQKAAMIGWGARYAVAGATDRARGTRRNHRS